MNVDGENDIAVILSSSGTSGPSKAVSLTHAAILDNLSHFYIMNENEIVFTFNSPSWMGGWLIILHSILNSLTLVISTEEFSPKLLLQIIEKYRVSVLLTATYHWQLMLKYDGLPYADLSTVKYCNILGSKMLLETKKAINALLPNGQVVTRYGMTEIGGAIVMYYPDTGTDAVGKLVRGILVKIVDDFGRRLGIGEDGEICVKKTHMFIGYYGNQESTDAIFDAEGFIQTGDIGHFDEDGLLFIVDRKKDIIICGEVRVSPSSIEGLLLEDSRIQTACVVGIDDVMLGELPAAVIVRSNSSDITAEEVHDIVVSKCCDYSQLRGGVYFVESLPLTTTAKLKRRHVKMMATDLHERLKNQKL